MPIEFHTVIIERKKYIDKLVPLCHDKDLKTLLVLNYTFRESIVKVQIV